MTRGTIATALILLTMSAMGQQEIKLYEGPAPGSENVENKERALHDANGQIQTIYGVVDPTITVYLPEKGKSKSTAVISRVFRCRPAELHPRLFSASGSCDHVPRLAVPV